MKSGRGQCVPQAAIVIGLGIEEQELLTAVSDNALGPRGEKHGRTDRTHIGGITPEKCAAAIVNGVACGSEEVHVGGKEVLGIYLKRYAPWLLSRIVRKMKFSVGFRDAKT